MSDAAGFSSLPYWWVAAPLEPQEAEQVLPRQMDVVVIGAGFTGLSAALTLSGHGRSVLVLEAGSPGQGASARNGGMLGPSFQKMSVDALSAAYGEAHTISLLQESMESMDYTLSLIESQGISCDVQKVGRFRGAVIPEHLDSIKQETEKLMRYIDLQAEIIEPQDQHREIGSDIYHGGVVYHRDAGLHPAKYLAGLLGAVRRSGATVAGHCPVTRLERDGDGWRVHTARGVVQARDVMLATNGYTDTTFPWFRRRLVPVHAAIIVTEPLPAAQIDRLLPKRRMYGETRRMMNFYRTTPDGTRLLIGGRPPVLNPTEARTVEHLRRRLIRLFPELSQVKVDYHWRGNVAFTFDHAPHMGQRDGIYYALGYCGSGVGRSTYFGHKTALKMLGKPEGKSYFDGLKFAGFPGYTGNPWPLPAVMSWYTLRDWMDSL